jgi:hypothetical protein
VKVQGAPNVLDYYITLALGCNFKLVQKNVLQKHRKIKCIKYDFTPTKIVLVRQMISLDFE